MNLRNKGVFVLSNWVFWIILGFILFLSMPYFKNGFFDEEWVSDWLLSFDDKLEQQETLNQDSVQTVFWSWRDFNNEKHEISFKIYKEHIIRAKKYRENYSELALLSRFYLDLIASSRPVLDSMANAMRADIALKKMDGMDVLNYVVTSIQNPVYVKISDSKECPCEVGDKSWVSDCRPRKDGKGCCNDVKPIGCYSPAEFIHQKTGDCDTKVVVAYALLKRFDYDVAVLIGNVEGGKHSMLGVAGVRPIISGPYIRFGGKLYYPWELTVYDNSFLLGNVNMWQHWSDWKVECN